MSYLPEISFSPEQVIIYLRKSRSDDPLLSVEEVLEKHENMLDEWSEKNLGGKVPEKNKYREIVSGETIEARPEIQEVLKQIESPKMKAVLVVEVQRLSRGDLEDAGRLIKLFRYTNTMVIIPQKIYDLQDEYDRDMFERELKRGNEFLEYTKKIMMRGRLLSVQQGNFIGNYAPYGYEKTVVMEGKKKCHTLKIKPDEADVVRMIFDLYVNKDMGRVNIAHKLNDLGIKPQRGDSWAQDTIKCMLENEHYTGKVRWNWRKTINVVEDGEIRKIRPKAKSGEYLIFEGKHEAIISDELFMAARAKQGKNHRAKSKTKVRNPLAGLLFCQCGRAMSLRTYKSNGVERSAPRLLCDNQAYCKTSSCLYDDVVKQVKKTLADCIEDFELKLQNENPDSQELQMNLVARLKTQLAELDKKEISIWDKYAEEAMPKHVFDSLNEKVAKDKEHIRQALKTAKESMPEPIDYQERLYRFQAALDALNNPEVTAAEKNRLLKTCIERIDYKREKSQRIQSQQKRITINGERKYVSPLNTGANWTNPPVELDIKLRV